MTRAQTAALGCGVGLAMLAAVNAVTAQQDQLATLRGRVLDLQGVALRSAHVEARNGGLFYETSTDAEGTFTLRVPAGPWAVTAAKAGYLQHQFGARRPARTVAGLDVQPGRLYELEFPLWRASVITGQVYDELGDPLAGAVVQAIQSRMRNGRFVRTVAASDLSDDSGTFRLHSLPPGDYYVSAGRRTAAPDSGAAPTYFPGTAVLSEATRLALAVGETFSAAAFTVAATRPVRLSGTVVDSTGAAAADATVELLRADDFEVVGRPFGNFGLTQQDGRFTILNVAAGSYALAAQVTRGGVRETAFTGVSVGSPGAGSVTLATRPGAALSGVLQRTTGGPLPSPMSGTVVARPLRGIGQVRSARITADHRFEVTGLFGPHFVDLEGLPEDWMLSSLAIGGTEVGNRAIDFPGSGRLDVIATIAPATSVNGRIDGPLADTSVVVIPDDPALVFYHSRYVSLGRTNADGTFRVTAMPAGAAYVVAVVAGFDDDELRDASILDRLRPLGTPVSLRERSAVNVGTLRVLQPVDLFTRR